MRVAVAADHNGTELKKQLIAWLLAAGHTVEDCTAQPDAEGAEDGMVDYPPLCAQVCGLVVEGAVDRGIVLGGSGLGETIACNKISGIRAGLCHDLWSTQISRGNNDSNVLVLAAKRLEPATALEIVDTWLTTPFKGGVHQRRLEQIAALEQCR